MYSKLPQDQFIHYSIVLYTGVTNLKIMLNKKIIEGKKSEVYALLLTEDILAVLAHFVPSLVYLLSSVR